MGTKVLTNEENRSNFLRAKKEIEFELEILKDDYKDDEKTYRSLKNIERKVTELMAFRDFK
ncbi:hypothetical protein ACIQ2D_08705 [Lysinibacillus sp. NPDC097287]|uniref:hypothetical protein n=1 Tax=Lysinibacillus sp. NPDC097287 TaxID=3364144 RepID=UPI00382F9042